MVYFFAGTLVLALGLLFIKWLSTTDVKNAKRALIGLLVLALVVLSLFLLATGKSVLSIPSALAAWVAFSRLRSAASMWNAWSSWRGRMSGSATGAGGTGATSTVETTWLRMYLDHDSGGLDGDVLKGPSKGKRLSQLERDQLGDLLLDVGQNDPEGLRLLERFMDHAFGADWQNQFNQDGSSSTGSGTGSGEGGGFSDGPMSREEAERILGVKTGASADDIRTAHRALMQKLHPDHGGSSYLAAKINEAKDTILP